MFNIQDLSKFRRSYKASPSKCVQAFGPRFRYQLLELVNLVTLPVLSTHFSLGHPFWEMFLESGHLGLQKHDKPSYNERMAEVLFAEYINYIMFSVQVLLFMNQVPKITTRIKLGIAIMPLIWQVVWIMRVFS